MIVRSPLPQWVLAVAVVVTGAFTSPVLAAPTTEARPQVIAHEGRLFDAAGEPLAGVVKLKFSLYPQQVGGAALWSEQVDVEFDDGHFDVWLGEATPLDPSLLDGKRRWLAVSVVDGPASPGRVAVASTTHPMFADDERQDGEAPPEDAPPPAPPVAPGSAPRPAGVVLSAAYADAPLGPLVTTRDRVFLGATVGMTVEPMQQAIVSASAGLGSTAPGGAGDLQLSICTRHKDSPRLVDDAGARRDGLTIAENTRETFALRARLAGLAPGEYEVGLCGHARQGAGRWNDNGTARVTVMITTR